MATVRQILKTAKDQAELLKCPSSIIMVFDQAIYAEAQMIRWSSDEEYQDILLPRLGEFYTVMSFMTAIGKRFELSAFEDILAESGVVAARSIKRSSGCSQVQRKHLCSQMHVWGITTYPDRGVSQRNPGKWLRQCHCFDGKLWSTHDQEHYLITLQNNSPDQLSISMSSRKAPCLLFMLSRTPTLLWLACYWASHQLPAGRPTSTCTLPHSVPCSLGFSPTTE